MNRFLNIRRYFSEIIYQHSLTLYDNHGNISILIGKMNDIGDDSVNDDDYWYVDNGDSITQPLNLKPQLESLTNNPTTQAPYDEPYNPADEESARYAWKVASWIIVALTLLLNLVIVVVIVINRNANSVINKGGI